MSSLPGVSRRILQYLERIDEGNGRAKRMDFLRIAGNESNLNDWIEYLTRCNLIGEVAPQEEGGRTAYVMTEFGRKVYELLKDYNYLGPLFSDLSRDRRRRQ